MLSRWLWWMRLRRVPAKASQLRNTRNWLAFVGRFGLAGHKADLIATSSNFTLDRDGFAFGTLYEAREDISVGYRAGPLKAGQRYHFMGFGTLPHDGILDYYFEAEDGTALNLIFEPMRGSDAKAAHTKLLNDRLLQPVASDSPRARDLQVVRWLLARLRNRNRVY